MICPVKVTFEKEMIGVMKFESSKGYKPCIGKLALQKEKRQCLVIWAAILRLWWITLLLQSSQNVKICPEKVTFEKEIIWVVKFESSKGYKPCICKLALQKKKTLFGVLGCSFEVIMDHLLAQVMLNGHDMSRHGYFTERNDRGDEIWVK